MSVVTGEEDTSLTDVFRGTATPLSAFPCERVKGDGILNDRPRMFSLFRGEDHEFLSLASFGLIHGKVCTVDQVQSCVAVFGKGG